MRKARVISWNHGRGLFGYKALLRVALIVLSLGLTMAAPPPVRAAELHVCSNCRYRKIQRAIDAAASGDTIKVAQGTYVETVKIIRKDITLLGGYSPPNWTAQGHPSTTIINANYPYREATIEVQGCSAVVDNFTITGGTGRYFPQSHSWTRGGGLFIWDDGNRSIVISDNIIEGNSAGEGAGLVVEGLENKPLHAQILRNVIRNNSAKDPGWGGGFSLIYATAVVKDNIVSNNTAKWGGGFHIWKSAPTIERNVITGNVAGASSERVGGGFFIELSSVFIRNNFIANNQAADYAAGIYIKIPYPAQPQPQIVNNTIVGNSTEGIVVRDNTNPIISNNIIALNHGGISRYNGSVPSVMSNNDVWNNGRNYIDLPPGTNDISADPLFVDQAGGDYHLRQDSPCIEAGTGQNAPDSDFDGDSRPLDGDLDGTPRWDIGADEHRIPYRLVITKEADPVSAQPEEDITFTITYRNAGGATLTGVKITDELSGDLQYLWSDPPYSNKVGNTYSWNVDSLGPGSSSTIVIRARIDPRLGTPAVITNTAWGDSAETDPVSDDAMIIVGGIENCLPLATSAD
jgi:uncharacterized repeat protein (TIGR01451 family)